MTELQMFVASVLTLLGLFIIPMAITDFINWLKRDKKDDTNSGAKFG